MGEVLAFALPFVSLLVVICGDLPPGDGSGFFAAAVAGGLPAPPGYPVSMLLHQGALWLPVGTLVFRTAVVSACLGGFVSLGLFRLVCALLAALNVVHRPLVIALGLGGAWAVLGVPGFVSLAAGPGPVLLQVAIGLWMLVVLCEMELGFPRRDVRPLYSVGLLFGLWLAEAPGVALWVLPVVAATAARAWLWTGRVPVQRALGFLLVGFLPRTHVWLAGLLGDGLWGGGTWGEGASPLHVGARYPGWGGGGSLWSLWDRWTSYGAASWEGPLGDRGLDAVALGAADGASFLDRLSACVWGQGAWAALFVVGALAAVVVLYRNPVGRRLGGLHWVFAAMLLVMLGVVDGSAGAQVATLFGSLMVGALVFAHALVWLGVALDRMGVVTGSRRNPVAVLLAWGGVLWSLVAGIQGSISPSSNPSGSDLSGSGLAAADSGRRPWPTVGVDALDDARRRSLVQGGVVVVDDPALWSHMSGAFAVDQTRTDLLWFSTAHLSVPGYATALVAAHPEVRPLVVDVLDQGQVGSAALQSLSAQRPLYLQPRVFTLPVAQTVVPDGFWYRVLGERAYQDDRTLADEHTEDVLQGFLDRTWGDDVGGDGARDPGGWAGRHVQYVVDAAAHYHALLGNGEQVQQWLEWAGRHSVPGS